MLAQSMFLKGSVEPNRACLPSWAWEHWLEDEPIWPHFSTVMASFCATDEPIDVVWWLQFPNLTAKGLPCYSMPCRLHHRKWMKGRTLAAAVLHRENAWNSSGTQLFSGLKTIADA